jgi:hypothetical protein
MASTITGDNIMSLSGAGPALARPVSAVSMRRRRQISQEAGRGIEMLGHAIEYLADEFSLDCMRLDGMDGAADAQADSKLGARLGVHPRIQAIELLMARNREIYLSCPVAPTWAERLEMWLPWLRA